MKKVYKAFIIAFVFFLVLFVLSVKTFCDYVSDLREQQANLQSQMEASTAQVELIQSDMSDLANEITALNEEITSQELEVQLLKGQNKELQENIKKTQDELDAATEKYNSQKKNLEERLVASFKAGETSYLDVLLQSNSLTEFISNYYLIEQMVESDNSMLEDMSTKKRELEEARLQLKKQQKQLAETSEESEKKAVALENMKVIKSSYISQLSQEEAGYVNQITEMQSSIKQVEAEILEASRNYYWYGYVGGEMAWPVPGYTRISSPYGMRTHPITGVYKLHTGVDISAPMGASFIAANDGIVVKAQYNSAYGNMVMINHGGGISTLYAHGSQILVEVGQQVSRGDEVLKVGSTGYSTGPHAHFEVRVNGQYTNPMPYITSQTPTTSESN